MTPNNQALSTLEAYMNENREIWLLSFYLRAKVLDLSSIQQACGRADIAVQEIQVVEPPFQSFGGTG